MSGTQNPGAKNFDSLRRDLKELRAKARESGVISSSVDDVSAPFGGLSASRQAAMDAMGPDDKSKVVAKRLLAMLRRGEGDESRIVPGTNFTEAGVQRLVDRLAAPRKEAAGEKVYQRLRNFLNRPGRDAGEMVAGVSVEKIRHLARFLEQVEKHGWEQVRAFQEKRGEATQRSRPTPA
jgi:hypothetical protein